MPVSQIELSLSPALYGFRSLTRSHTTVAVDILRATTAVCAAFQAGAEEVVPLDSLDALEGYRRQGCLLAAERSGRKVDGAECGNSPTEYLAMDLHGQRLAYSTTNGTVCMLRGSDADRTLVGAFANISRLTALLLEKPQDLVILCSGWKNEFSIEDTLFAGALCQQLLDSGRYRSAHDPVQMALTLWHACRNNPYEYCMEHASHVQRLLSFGASADIEFAFRRDTCPVLPLLHADGILRCI